MLAIPLFGTQVPLCCSFLLNDFLYPYVPGRSWSCVSFFLPISYALIKPHIGSVSSVAQSCLTFCDHMKCSTAGLQVHHHLREFTQTHVHWVGNAIQPSHPLSSPSPPAPSPSQHQSLFQWVNSSHDVVEFAQIHVHWVGDAIQSSHLLSPLSPPALNLSQDQSLFQWVSSSLQVAEVLELQLQYQSF